MTFPGNFYVDTATVETFLGRGARGDSYATAATVACYVDDDRKLVRTGDGAEVVSESTLFTAPGHLTVFTSGTRVTVNGTAQTVIAVHNRHHPLVPALNHLEIALT